MDQHMGSLLAQRQICWNTLPPSKAIDKKYGPFEAAVGHSFGGMAISKHQRRYRQFLKQWSPLAQEIK